RRSQSLNIRSFLGNRANVESLGGSSLDPLVLTFSFSAGMVSAFNPCGAVLLPTYLAHLFAQGGRVREHKGFRRLVEGASAGMIMTLGFVCVCFSAGLLITLA